MSVSFFIILAWLGGCSIGFAIASVLGVNTVSSWQDAARIMAQERDKWKQAYHDLAAKNHQEGEEWKE